MATKFKIFQILGLQEILDSLSSGGSSTFVSDILVSLSGGKTFGKYSNGQTIPATGKTPNEVILLAAIEDIFPTYTPATNVLSGTASATIESGTAFTNSLTSNFTQNDAGGIITNSVSIKKNGVNLTTPPPTLASATPFNKTDSGTYVFGTPITYQAFVSYAAGIIKTMTPSGLPDPRPALIRNVNAPQSAETAFGSNTITITPDHKEFYGPTASNSTTSAQVRALPNNRFVTAGNSFSFNTGNTLNIFEIAVPLGKTLSQVIDVTIGNVDITTFWVNTGTISVNDAGGTPVTNTLYRLTNGSPYSSSHQFNIILV